MTAAAKKAAAQKKAATAAAKKADAAAKKTSAQAGGPLSPTRTSAMADIDPISNPMPPLPGLPDPAFVARSPLPTSDCPAAHHPRLEHGNVDGIDDDDEDSIIAVSVSEASLTTPSRTASSPANPRPTYHSSRNMDVPAVATNHRDRDSYDRYSTTSFHPRSSSTPSGTGPVASDLTMEQLMEELRRRMGSPIPQPLVKTADDFLQFNVERGRPSDAIVTANVAAWASAVPSTQRHFALPGPSAPLGVTSAIPPAPLVPLALTASRPAPQQVPSSDTGVRPSRTLAAAGSNDSAGGLVVPAAGTSGQKGSESVGHFIRALLLLEEMFPVGPGSGKYRWAGEIASMMGVSSLPCADFGKTLTNTRNNMFKSVPSNVINGLDANQRADILTLRADGIAAGVSCVHSFAWCETVLFSRDRIRPLFQVLLTKFLAVHTKPPLCQLMSSVVHWRATQDRLHSLPTIRSEDLRHYAVPICVGIWMACSNQLANHAGCPDWKKDMRGNDHLSAYTTSIAAIQADAARVRSLAGAVESAINGLVLFPGDDE